MPRLSRARCTDCGQRGKFVSWLTIATAYRDTYLAEFLREDDRQNAGSMYLRPAIPL